LRSSSETMDIEINPEKAFLEKNQFSRLYCFA